MTGFVPYCGVAPVPGGLHWNFDPALIGALVVLAGRELGHRPFEMRVIEGGTRPPALGAGSFSRSPSSPPLCNLSVALFSARVAQHMAIDADRGAPDCARIAFRAPARPAASRGSRRMELHSLSPRSSGSGIVPPSTTRHCVTTPSTGLMHVTTVAAALALWIPCSSSSAAVAFLLSLRHRLADVAARRFADLCRRSPVLRTRVHHGGLGTYLASGSRAWRACDVGARWAPADWLIRLSPSGLRSVSTRRLLRRRKLAPPRALLSPNLEDGVRVHLVFLAFAARAREPSPQRPTISPLCPRIRSNG